MNLLLSDYQKLLDLADGKKPVWNTTELTRCCNEHGLITPSGTFLTPAGERKVARIREAVEQLRIGVPLDTERENRSSAIRDELWFRAKIDGRLCLFNKSALFTGTVPDDFRVIRWHDDAPRVRRLQATLIPGLDSSSLAKLVPVALQRNTMLSLESICFTEISKRLKPNPPIHRVQSKYYDYILQRWPECSWWASKANLILVWASDRYSLRNGFVAAIMPVKAKEWPSPRIDMTNLSAKDEPCQSTVKQKSTKNVNRRPRKQKNNQFQSENTTELQNTGT